MTQHPNTKKRALHRIRILQGQLRGIERMLEANTYCVNVLTQSLAVQKSLKSLDGLILQQHLNTCVLSHMKGTQSKKYIDELLRLYRDTTH